VSDLLESVSSALADRYAIEREVGRGGMAIVYQARDLRHERQVAVKVLRPEIAVSLGPDRFLREIRIVAGLTHPHILPLHDSGDVDGLLYFVMPYLEGESVRQRIDRERQLPLDDAVQIARAAADALDYAHRHGVVHRDIKPANILLEEGRAFVSDFGIARAVSVAVSERITDPGIALGTPAYLSPEQAAGEAEIDGRSDVYSLGCVLYEMLVGEPPFTGPTPQAVIAKRFALDVAPMSAIRDTIPSAVDRVAQKALARTPVDRYDTAGEFADALEQARTAPAGFGGTGPAEHSIAVLPFGNLSADPENEYFSDGVTEEIINALSQVEGLHVAARTSSFAFKHRAAEISEVGSTLKVATVLEGSVRKAGNRIRITTQLVNVEDGYHLWSERYDREMGDVFAVQDEIARAIVNTLKVKLLGEHDAPLVKEATKNVEAYTHYLKGRYYWNKRTQTGLLKGINHFDAAVDEDGMFALAYAGLADSHNILGFYDFVPPSEAFPQAKAAALMALEMDEGLAEAHAALAYELLYYDWDFVEAERSLFRAMELNPSYAIAPHYYGNYLVAMGQFDEADAAFRRARELDPLSLIINAASGWAMYHARRHEEAVALLSGAIELDPDFFLAHLWLARTLSQMQRFDEATAEAERARTLSDDAPIATAALGQAYALSGARERAAAVLEQMYGQAGERHVSPYYVAGVHAALEDRAAALEWLERAFEERSHSLVFLKVDPVMEPLRGEPEFAALVERVGLP
jgi:serine/threonine-protein kinase